MRKYSIAGGINIFCTLSSKRIYIPDYTVLDVEQPEIASYPVYATPCAIMQCHTETREWLLSNFIQICSNTEVLNFYDFNYKECPFLCVQRISKKFLADWGINILQFILYNLSKENYVYLLVKRKFINAYYLDGIIDRVRDNCAHNIMIYGYDVQQQIFYIADNFYGGKYVFAQCTFGEMEQAIAGMLPEDETQGGFNGNIELIKYSLAGRPDLSVQRILESLSDYLYCRPTGMWNIMEIRNYNRNRKWYFGQDCYEYMISKVREMGFSDIRIQDFHLLWEHKKHLRDIFQYLLEKKYINNDTVILKAEKIANKALCVRNLIIKYSITKRNEIKSDVIDIYKTMKTEEGELIYEIIDQLEGCDKERLMWGK